MLGLDVNWLAVIVAAVAGMVFGALWYSPLLFGNLWMKLSGLTKKDLEKAKKKGMGKAYTFGFVIVLVMSFVLYHMINLFGTGSMGSALTISFWLWLGFVATVMLNEVLWANKSFNLYLLNVIHTLIAMWIMAAILVTL